jgi:spore coat protein U domain-containing protein, fimbrial subunit CupE1/2/3/6
MRARSKIDYRLHLIAAAATVGLLPSASTSFAATSTATFSVQVTIVATCTINSASALNFGSQGVFTANVDQTSTIQVQCTNTTPYNIGLDAGLGTGATVAVRKMTSGGATVNYTLYSDSGRTTVWGTTIGTNTVAATGNGAAQSYTVYGRIPAQTTPAPGTYADTVTITVTY